MTEKTPDSNPKGSLRESLANLTRDLHAGHTCVPGKCECMCGCQQELGCTLTFGTLCGHCMVREMRDGEGGLHAYPGPEDSSEHVAQALRRAALVYPEQRAMQIVFNALDAQGLARDANHLPKDIFYAENAVLSKALRAYAAASPLAETPYGTTTDDDSRTPEEKAAAKAKSPEDPDVADDSQEALT